MLEAQMATLRALDFPYLPHLQLSHKVSWPPSAFQALLSMVSRRLVEESWILT